MDMTTIQVKLNDIINFLDPLLPLANSHMVDFITDNLWELLTPNDVKAEIDSASTCNIKDVFRETFVSVFDQEIKVTTIVENDNRDYTDSPCSTSSQEKMAQWFPKLFHFLSAARDVLVSSSSDILSRSELQGKLRSFGSGSHTSLHMKQFMTCKKAHEVEVMSEVVSSLANVCHVSYVVDVGSGKGYLSSMLALHHGLSVLGIDSSQITSHGAVKRTNKLVRVWNGISKKVKWHTRTSTCSSHEQETHQKAGDSRSSNDTNNSPTNKFKCNAAERCKYKQATLFVTSQLNMTHLLENYFPGSFHPYHLALVGLHTCGGLAPTAFRLFELNEHIRGLCNVGCCYHLLNEEFSLEHTDPKESSEYDFPMSAFLRSKQFVLGRNARMLAAQSVHRIVKTELSLESVFYRAVFQVLLKDKLKHDIPQVNVGRLASKCSSFSQYVHKAMGRLGVDLKVSEEEIEAIYTEHSKNQEYLHAFFVMRLSLSPIIERIIILDRLLFLLEQGIKDAYLVQMFDPVVSPRCYGIVAWKSESLLA